MNRRRKAWFVLYQMVKYLPDRNVLNPLLDGTRLRSALSKRFVKKCGRGLQVQQSVGLPFEVSFGDEVFIGKGTSIEPNVTFGSNIWVGHDCLFLTGSRQHYGWPIQTIEVEDNAWIGSRAIILQGVRIGASAVVGAGAVVSHDVAPGRIAVGNPAIVTKKKRRSADVRN